MSLSPRADSQPLIIDERRLHEAIDRLVDQKMNQLRHELVDRLSVVETKAARATSMVREEVSALANWMETVAPSEDLDSLEERIQKEMSELTTTLSNLTSALKKDTTDRMDRSDCRVASLATQLTELEDHTHNECVKRKGIEDITEAFNQSIAKVDESFNIQGEQLRRQLQTMETRTGECEQIVSSKYEDLVQMLNEISKVVEGMQGTSVPSQAAQPLAKATSPRIAEKEIGRLRKTVHALTERVDIIEQALR